MGCRGNIDLDAHSVRRLFRFDRRISYTAWRHYFKIHNALNIGISTLYFSLCRLCSMPADDVLPTFCSAELTLANGGHRPVAHLFCRNDHIFWPVNQRSCRTQNWPAALADYSSHSQIAPPPGLSHTTSLHTGLRSTVSHRAGIAHTPPAHRGQASRPTSGSRVGPP